MLSESEFAKYVFDAVVWKYGHVADLLVDAPREAVQARSEMQRYGVEISHPALPAVETVVKIQRWNHPSLPEPSVDDLRAITDEFISSQILDFNKLRAERDAKLAASDWVVLKAVDQSQDGLGIQIPVVWLNYRQALRDLPANTADPANPVWPKEP